MASTNSEMSVSQVRGMKKSILVRNSKRKGKGWGVEREKDRQAKKYLGNCKQISKL